VTAKTSQQNPPPGELLCTSIRRADQALMAHHDAVLRRFGLTLIQYTVLLLLERSQDGMSGAQLARASSVTQQTMASVLSNMQDKGLVDREPSAVHARVFIVRSTPSGKMLFKDAYEEVIVLEQELSRAFSAKERATLSELLERTSKLLNEEAAKVASAD
jgi:DNA-binding MarR family transcriptional regulator